MGKSTKKVSKKTSKKLTKTTKTTQKLPAPEVKKNLLYIEDESFFKIIKEYFLKILLFLKNILLKEIPVSYIEENFSRHFLLKYFWWYPIFIIITFFALLYLNKYGIYNWTIYLYISLFFIFIYLFFLLYKTKLKNIVFFTVVLLFGLLFYYFPIDTLVNIYIFYTILIVLSFILILIINSIFFIKQTKYFLRDKIKYLWLSDIVVSLFYIGSYYFTFVFDSGDIKTGDIYMNFFFNILLYLAPAVVGSFLLILLLIPFEYLWEGFYGTCYYGIRRFMSFDFWKKLSGMIHSLKYLIDDFMQFILYLITLVIFFFIYNFTVYNFHLNDNVGLIESFFMYISRGINILWIFGILFLLGIYLLKYWKLILKYILKYILTFKIFFLLFSLAIAIKINFDHDIIVNDNYQYLMGFIFFFAFLDLQTTLQKFNIHGSHNLFKKLFEKSGKISVFIKNYLEYDLDNKNFIKPLSDEPISGDNGNDDVFDIGNFVQNISHLIRGVQVDKSSFSIGIVGEWGEGKSSSINYLKKQYIEGYPEYDILEFNPWNYEKNDLIEKFFTDLSAKINNRGVSRSINKYLNALGELHKGFKFLYSLYPDQTLDDIKQELKKKLADHKKKIIVIIDDLDRCIPEEVIIMLNLIKNIGDLPNIVYLVSYDKKNISRILEKEFDNKDYIEKIVNIERFLPLNKELLLENYFKRKIQFISMEIFSNKLVASKDYYDGLVNLAKTIFKSDNPFDLDYHGKKISINEFLKLTIDPHLNGNEGEIPDLKENGFTERNLKKYIAIKNHVIKFSELILEDSKKGKSFLKFHNFFMRENMRFIKKIVNQLNLLLQVNLLNNKSRVLEIIRNRYVFEEFLLINYIKLKDYDWFVSVLNEKNLFVKWEIIYDQNIIPDVFKEKNLNPFKKEFLDLIGIKRIPWNGQYKKVDNPDVFGEKVSTRDISENDKIAINSSDDKIIIQNKDIEKNIEELIENFS